MFLALCCHLGMGVIQREFAVTHYDSGKVIRHAGKSWVCLSQVAV